MKKIISFLRYVIPTTLLVLILSFLIVTATQAGTLSAVYVFLSRLKINLSGTGSEAVEMILAIDTSTSVASGSTIKIEFPDAEDTEWCRTAGALTVSGVTSSAVDLASSNWSIDEALPTSGTLTATCTQGAGTGTVDTITISNVGALTAGTTYGVKISSGAGILGTASTAEEHVLSISVNVGGVPVDSKSIKIYLVNDDTVVVTATVANIASVSCSISSNSINLGTLYPGGTYITGSHTIGTSTSSNGYYWAVYGKGNGSTDAGLWNGTTLIQSGPTETLNLASATVSGFGMTLSDPDDTDSATVTTNFKDTVPGLFGTIDRLYSGAKLVLYQNGPQSSPESSTVTYGAKAPSDATTGPYNESVYFICGGYY
jgi:hypothetical protein